MEKYLEFLKENGADLAVQIPADTIETAPWTVYRCQYGCDFYGKKRCCPPYAPKWQETQAMIDCFQYGILFRIHDLKMVTPLAIKLSRELFLDGYYKTIAFGAGPCEKCARCNLEHCNFPKQVVPAMEACGIDVFATVRNNGMEINTIREKEEPHNYFGLVLVE